jgi:hypothetical protein
LKNKLLTTKPDFEGEIAEEDILDLRIYSILVLLKLRRPRLNVEKVKELIGELEKKIGEPAFRVSGLAGDSETETNAELDRVMWKAIYLCGLLFKILPPSEREGLIERVRGYGRYYGAESYYL